MLRKILFCLLANAATLLAAGFLTLETTPPGVEVWAIKSGTNKPEYMGDSPFLRRELPPGRYELLLIQNGKDTLRVPDVEIQDGQYAQISKEMPANYSSLSVQTEPDSGEVWLDGVKLGNSPYFNNLVLPGTYTLKLVPREAWHRRRIEKIQINKGDSLHLDRPFSFRDKSFLEENLSMRAGAFQLEGGYQFGSIYGRFDSTGKRINQSFAKRNQNDFPLTLRVGFPFGLETHFQLPFDSYRQDSTLKAPFSRDFSFGLKYTYRPLGVGADISYSVGSDTAKGGFNHDRLAVTLLGCFAKNQILLLGNGGYELHFTDKDNNHLTPGDELFVNAKVGYAAEGFMPYLGVLGRFRLNGTKDIESLPGGHVLGVEPGMVVDIADWTSFQFGIPFTLIGKNNPNYWALHLSIATRFNWSKGK